MSRPKATVDYPINCTQTQSVQMRIKYDGGHAIVVPKNKTLVNEMK